MRRALRCAYALALLATSTAGFAAAMQVQVGGAVTTERTAMLKDHARLSDAALAARPLPTAYMLGAAWLRPSLRESQQRLKAGILFDLTSLQQRAISKDKPELATLAGNLLDWIKPMPVTGRQPALLDPRAVEVDAPENHPLADGDRLYYPLRPDTIRVVGAVRQACSLPLVPLQDARLYLASCPMADQADRDTIYVIEPDGRMFVEDVALWNRTVPKMLAPGALIYVPLSTHAIKPVDPSLNDDLAAFLATQLLPGPGVE
ncbi:hypothetical protein B0E46_01955 [Rhodanobacter sp. B04]|uniref:capsule biosynthesis GfcC family protein n=1 Tax=Rhodanobacter sp. B04 TaxID=1945860 RepID=UPI000986B9F8|nr:capsule biosynthesis GfcC family protein [Rhodanobacter sp. B04]OOG66267.1 hypothetical protein B0E46_01955 [Rhodanobacter sp. B04]